MPKMIARKTRNYNKNPDNWRWKGKNTLIQKNKPNAVDLSESVSSAGLSSSQDEASAGSDVADSESEQPKEPIQQRRRRKNAKKGRTRNAAANRAPNAINNKVIEPLQRSSKYNLQSRRK